LNSALEFFPAMPPRTVSGKVTMLHASVMRTMVPKGRAAVDCRIQKRWTRVRRARKSGGGQRVLTPIRSRNRRIEVKM